MMSPPGFQTYVRPPVTLTFDLLTPEVDRSCHSKYRVHKLVTDATTLQHFTPIRVAVAEISARPQKQTSADDIN